MPPYYGLEAGRRRLHGSQENGRREGEEGGRVEGWKDGRMGGCEGEVGEAGG